MRKQAMHWLVTAVVGVGVVSAGCSTPGGRFAGGVASTIAGGGLLVAVQRNPGCIQDGCWFAQQREGLDTLGYVVGAALVAVGVALLIPDMRDRSTTAPVPAPRVPGAAGDAPRRIAPEPEVRVAAPPLGDRYRM